MVGMGARLPQPNRNDSLVQVHPVLLKLRRVKNGSRHLRPARHVQRRSVLVNAHPRVLVAPQYNRVIGLHVLLALGAGEMLEDDGDVVVAWQVRGRGGARGKTLTSPLWKEPIGSHKQTRSTANWQHEHLDMGAHQQVRPALGS